MAELPELIREYCAVLEQESRLDERKERLRTQILAEMSRLNVTDVRYPHGTAQRGAVQALAETGRGAGPSDQ